jgi:hypothetical protein
MEKEATKNLGITLPVSDVTDLEFLVNYFQQQSISAVSKTDVIKYLIRRYKLLIENQQVDEIQELIRRELELT